MPLILLCSECNHDQELNIDLEKKFRSHFNLEKSDDLVEGIKRNQNKIPCSKCGARVVKVVELKKCKGCGKKIPAGRIFAIPKMEYCIDCVNSTVNEDDYDPEEEDLGHCPWCEKYYKIKAPLVWRERKVENPIKNFSTNRWFVGCSRHYKGCFYSRKEPKNP